MQTIQFELGGGASVALPADTVAQRLIEQLRIQGTPPSPLKRPKIGEYLSGQGGIYVGDIRGDDGRIYGLIDAGKDAAVKGTWGANGGIEGLSDWDGLTNTIALRKRGCPAADLCAKYERDGHTDFYLPARRELIIAQANLPHLYDKGWHWTSTPYGEGGAWAVVFESGSVDFTFRSTELLARPFRRFTYSSI